MSPNSVHVLFSFVALFLVFSMAAPDVYSTFQVSRTAPKGQEGSCQGYPDIQPVYREAIEMAQASLDALKTFDTVATVKATVQTFFGVTDSSSDDFKFIQATYQAMIDKSNTIAQNNDPAFFCDNSYLVHSEMWYDPQSGARTTSTYSEVSTRSGDPKPKGEKYWWIPLLKKFRPSGWAPGCNSPRKFGYVPRTRDWLVMCPAVWTDPNTRDTLAPYRGQNPKRPEGNLNLWGSQPAAFLHEFAHLVKDGVIDQSTQDAQGNTIAVNGAVETFKLAQRSPQGAVRNADNYRWFAIAMYLPYYDWSRGLGGMISKQQQQQPPKPRARRIKL